MSLDEYMDLSSVKRISKLLDSVQTLAIITINVSTVYNRVPV